MLFLTSNLFFAQLVATKPVMDILLPQLLQIVSGSFCSSDRLRPLLIPVLNTAWSMAKTGSYLSVRDRS